jgi:phage-related protein
MAGIPKVRVQFDADFDQLKKGVKGATNEVQSFGSKVGDFAKKAGAAFALAAVAATAFAVKFGKDALAAGEAADTANSRIQQINESMGLFGESTAGVNQSLIKYAEATARATGVDTNSIKATQAKLLTFKELAATADQLGGNFERTTKAAIDLGAAGFGTAELNAVALGKALNDPIKGISALTRNGITFTESEKERIKVLVESNKIGEAQNMILKAIETQVGGTAEATANATDRMRVGFTQVEERIGLALLPVLEKFTSFMLDKVFPAFEEYVAPAVQKLVDLFSNESGGLGNSLSNIFNLIKGIVLPIFEGLVSAFNKIKSAITKNNDELEPFFNLIKGIAEFAVKYLAPAISEVLGAAFKVLGGIISGIVTVFAKLVSGINATVNAVKALASALANSVVGKAVSGIASGIGSVFGGGRAQGGSVTGGTPYLVGERGAELFVPQSSGSIVPNSSLGGGTTINLTVNGAIDSEGAARQIIALLNNSYYRGTSGAGALVT